MLTTAEILGFIAFVAVVIAVGVLIQRLNMAITGDDVPGPEVQNDEDRRSAAASQPVPTRRRKRRR